MLFRFVKFLVRCFMRIFFRLKIYNMEKFPTEGAAIVAMNHRSNWDAPLCASIFPRKLRFMAKQELFKNALLGGLLKWAGGFPVARGTADVGAIKTAMKLLKSGECLAMFPEGRRVKEGEPHEVKSGVAMIAEKTSAPVIPIAIKGKYGFMKKIEIFVGDPIYVASEDGSKLSHDEIHEFSKEIMRGVLEMAGEDVESLGC